MKAMNEWMQEIVEDLEKVMQCNCDLDNWKPEKNTGHSYVCRIHKEAVKRYYDNGIKPMTTSEWIS